MDYLKENSYIIFFWIEIKEYIHANFNYNHLNLYIIMDNISIYYFNFFQIIINY